MDALVESMKRYKRFRRAQAMHLKAIASAVTGTVDAATAAAAAQAGDTAFHGDLGSSGAHLVPRNMEMFKSKSCRVPEFRLSCYSCLSL